MWDLVLQPGTEPRPPALGTWSLSHWTTREISAQRFLTALEKCKWKLQWDTSSHRWERLSLKSLQMEKKGTLIHCWWECKWVQPLWKKYAGSSETKRRITQQCGICRMCGIWPSNPTPGHIARRIDNSERCMNPNAQSSTIHNSQDMETT